MTPDMTIKCLELLSQINDAIDEMPLEAMKASCRMQGILEASLSQAASKRPGVLQAIANEPAFVPAAGAKNVSRDDDGTKTGVDLVRELGLSPESGMGPDTSPGGAGDQFRPAGLVETKPPQTRDGEQLPQTYQ